jgi:hypothetical protein
LPSGSAGRIVRRFVFGGRATDEQEALAGPILRLFAAVDRRQIMRMIAAKGRALQRENEFLVSIDLSEHMC